MPADVSRKRARRAEPGAVAPKSAATPARVPAVDALRGLAIVAMVAYHFSFDLTYFHLTRWDFYHDVFWLHARTLILSAFMLIAGVSLVLAERNPTSPAKFWRHVAIIATCAVGVSAASYLLFPESWIWFGVLHAIAVSLVLARPLVRRPGVAFALGIAVIAAGNLVANSNFDNRAFGWIGFMTAKPGTEDYVPLFPWFGVLLLGVAAGHALLRSNCRTIRFAANWPHWMGWMGRHSLAIYMLHQPMLIGLLFLVTGGRP